MSIHLGELADKGPMVNYYLRRQALLKKITLFGLILV